MPGGPFSQFFYGTKPVPLHKANFDNRPQTADAARRVISHCIPSGILLKASEAWRRTQLNATTTNRNQLTPMNKFDRALGLTLASTFSNHLLRSYNKVKNKKSLACTWNNPLTGCDSSPLSNTQPTDNPIREQPTQIQTIQTIVELRPDHQFLLLKERIWEHPTHI